MATKICSALPNKEAAQALFVDRTTSQAGQDLRKLSSVLTLYGQRQVSGATIVGRRPARESKSSHVHKYTLKSKFHLGNVKCEPCHGRVLKIQFLFASPNADISSIVPKPWNPHYLQEPKKDLYGVSLVFGISLCYVISLF